MSIWTDLLIMRGHIATPLALALVTSPSTSPPVPPASGTDSPARDADPALGTRPEVYAHPLRAVGQLW